MRDDRLLEMRVFKAVVETGGFTAAAHMLGVSQPYVSRTLTQMEQRLGVQLLHRTTRGRRLTAEGEAFLASCNRILDAVDQAEAQLASARTQAKGDLRVSAPLAFGMDQVVPRLPDFLAARPNVRLHLSLTDSVVNMIETNTDVAIRMGRLQDSTLMSRRLCNLQRIVVASPAFVDQHGMPFTPYELVNFNCLLWEGAHEHLNRWPFLVDGQTDEVTVRGNFHSSDGQTLFQMCTAGVGIMRCAEHMALPAIRAGVLIPLLQAYQSRDDTAIHAVFLPERELLPRVRAFVDYLVDIFHSPPWMAGRLL